MQTQTCETAQMLKAEGMRRVDQGNKTWKENALKAIEKLPVGWIGTGEAIRKVVGVEPSHPNAWGSLTRMALKRELIFPTGDYIAMTAKKSHGRKTPVYERM